MRENAKEDIFPNNSFLIDLEGFGVMCLFFFFLRQEEWVLEKREESHYEKSAQA